MISMLLMISWIMSTLFLFLNHPLSFGLTLLIQTFIVSMITGLMNFNFWFSYILFLVMVGGMLILFIYMTSIASNEKFKFSSMIFLMVLSLLSLTLMSFFLDSLLPSNLLTSMDLTNQNILFTNQFSLTKFLNWPMNFLLATIIIYLLITLIMVVKITKIQYGPLRQKF
nr:NADH dehydrogenase subunit 6 [Tsivoka simplicicollis]